MSDIWKYFKKLAAEEKAECNKCKKKYSIKGSSTKGLWDHLKQHKDIAQTAQKIQTSKKSAQRDQNEHEPNTV